MGHRRFRKVLDPNESFAVTLFCVGAALLIAKAVGNSRGCGLMHLKLSD